jgi:hypothetical protein
MFRSKIGEWSYYLGCISTAAAIVYRLFWFGTLGARLFGAAPRVVPHSFLDLGVLLFVLSIASNTRAAGGLDERKATAASKGQ